jgi:hypothetical protein
MIFVEVLDRRGHVAERVRLDALPVTIGRSYRNAVIVDDRYVSPEHLRIAVEPDGLIVVEDLQSENGLHLEPSGTRVPRIVVSPGMRLRIGHTVLRFATADQAVAATTRDPLGDRGGWAWLRYSRRNTALVLSAALVLSILTAYFTSYDEASAASRVSGALMLGVGLAAWAGAWALVTRITAHRFAFGPHLAVVSTVLLAGEVVNVGLRLFDLVESGTVAADVADMLLITLAFAALLYGHLALTSTLPGPKRLVWGVGVAVALVGLVEFTDWADRDAFVGSPRFEGAVSPVGAGADRGISIDAFIADADRLQQAVDALAQQSPH